MNRDFVPNPSTRSPYIIALSRMNALTEAYEEVQNMVADLGLEPVAKPGNDEEQVLDEAGAEESSEAGREKDEGVEEGLDRVQAETEVMASKSDLAESPPTEGSDLHVAGNQEEKKARDETQASPEKVPADDPVLLTEVPSLGPRLPKNFSTSLKNVQNAYNSLINAAGRAGDHKVAESLFTEVSSVSADCILPCH